MYSNKSKPIQSWTLILDFLLFPIFVLIFILPYSLLWLYSYFVKVIAKLCHPELISLKGADPLFSLDICKKGVGDDSLPEVRQNIGWVIRVQIKDGDNIRLEWIQDKFSNSFLKEDLNGNKEYPNFFTYLVRFGGYTFKKPVPFLEIHHHIYERELGKSESLEDFTSKWLGKGFQEKSPMWEIALITNTGTVDENVILFKVNHSCGDGYNLIHILDTLADNNCQYLVKEFDESI